MKTRCYLFVFFLLFTYSGMIHAQEQECSAEGLMKLISKDSILTIDISTYTQMPKAKQKVDVTKKFTMGRMQGTVGIASGQIISFDKKVMKVQVLEYKSTVIENGVKGHLIKPGDVTLITWKDKLVPTYDSEQQRAQKFIDEEKYAQALPIMDSLIKVKPQEDALILRGYCYFLMENYQAAVDDMTRVLTANPKEQESRLIRVHSYARMEKYEDALKDNEILLSQTTDTKKEMRYLKDQVYIIDKLTRFGDPASKDKLCKINTRLLQLDPKNMDFYNDVNYYCKTYNIADDQTNYTPLKVVSHSTDKFKLVTTSLKKIQYDWYGKSMTLNRKPVVGTYVNLEEIGANSAMTIATARVSKVEGETIELEIMYWGVRMNNKPVMYDLSDGTTDILINW
jgi:hypothetical protein